MADDKHREAEAAKRAKPAPSSSLPLSEKQRRELWIYIMVSLVAVELLLLVGAMLYGFLNAPGGEGGWSGFAFPWLSWGALAVIAPTLILLLVHSADVGLFRAPCGASTEQEWQKLLPARMQKLYRIITGAPVVAVLLGLIALGAGLLTLEGAFSTIARFGSALVPYIPHIVAGLTAIACFIIGAVVWINARTRRLMAEYEFRREVLEKTGVIIVDKGSTPLPPGGTGDIPYAVVSAKDAEKILPHALPAGQNNACYTVEAGSPPERKKRTTSPENTPAGHEDARDSERPDNGGKS